MKSILRQIIKFDEYKNCSKSSEIAQKFKFLEIMIYRISKMYQEYSQFSFKSDTHSLSTIKVINITLNYGDDKIMKVVNCKRRLLME